MHLLVESHRDKPQLRRRCAVDLSLVLCPSCIKSPVLEEIITIMMNNVHSGVSDIVAAEPPRRATVRSLAWRGTDGNDNTRETKEAETVRRQL